MIAEIPLGDLCGYLGAFWCIANLLWAVFRNDAPHAVMYGVGVFASTLVALNWGGILNEWTWSIFGLLVFGLHMMIYAWQHVWWKVPIFGILFAASTAALLGVI